MHSCYIFLKSKTNCPELPEMESGVAWLSSVAAELAGNGYSSIPI